MTPTKLAILVADLLLLIFITQFLPVEESLAKGLGVFIFIAVLWIAEVFHVSVTALLVPVLAVLFGIYDLPQALTNFANPIIFLFLGGFALAAAMHHQQLDLAIANNVLRLSGGSMFFSSLMVFGLTAFISMWISNTATVAMMLPLVLGLLSRLDYTRHKSTYLYFLLGTAYSGSIGGMGTLVGSPPNAIAAAATGISFSGWMKFGIPMVLISLPVIITALYFLLKPRFEHELDSVDASFTMNAGRWKVAVIFTLAVLAWIFSKPLAQALGITKSFDSIVALSAIVALAGSGVVGWKEIERTADWGVLLLFGGGITLSAILKTTGTSAFLAESISSMMDGAAILLFILVTIGFVVFMTELASNTASTALLVPIFMSIATVMELSSDTLAVAIALSASCAFMLPVVTPPNAIVFGSGYVPQRDMMRVGLYLNITFITLISLLAYLFI